MSKLQIEDLKNMHLEQWLNDKAELGITFEERPTQFAIGGKLVSDAAIDMQTVANSGIPVVAATYVDPTIIKQLFAPMVATKLYPENRKSTFAGTTALFPRVEEGYEIAAYDDFTDTGSVSVNSNWEQRTNARFQTTNNWGVLEQERYGLAKIPYIAMKQLAAVKAINRFMNKSYIYGISGMANYGLINDPALEAALTPITNASSKIFWSDKDATDIYNDILKMVTRLAQKNNGLFDSLTPIKIAVSPASEQLMNKINTPYNTTTAWQRIKETYKNAELVSVPEFDSVSGGLVQVIASELGGDKTGECIFSEKMRSFQIIPKSSYYSQKVAAGSFGTVIYHPSAVVQMTGISA